MQVSPVHDKGITIRIDDEEVKREEVQKEEIQKEGQKEAEEDETEEEAEEETEEDEGSDEETFGFRPQKKPAPVFVPPPKRAPTVYWIAPFDE